MPVIRSSSKWKSFTYENETTSKDAEFQYLSTFEELTDYELAKDSLSPKKKSTGKVKKRKLTSEKDESTENAADPVKKRRKTKKRAVADDSTEGKPTGDHDNTIEMQFDMTTWENLLVPDQVIRALKILRFTQPTAIQQGTLPSAIRDKLDILGAAETGSGKTLAFGIPIIAGLLEQDPAVDSNSDSTPFGPKALILTPTRELALQINQHIVQLLKFIDNIKIACVVGGLSVQKQERLLKKKPEILIATPGRLWALMKEGSNYVKDLYQSIRYLAIDETDRMLEQGHYSELSSILEILNKDPSASSKRQTFVFSATLTYVHPPPKRLQTSKHVKPMTTKDKINMLTSLVGLRKQHKVIDVTRKFGTAEGVTETRLNCGNLLEKDTYLYYFLIRYPGRTLIFANSIDCCRRLHSLLTQLRFQPLILHAHLHQKQRLKNLERFSDKEGSILLATDVAARGLDIKNIQHVLHYQVPRTPEIYIHRSGRTARSNEQGLSVMLVDSKDVSFYRRICRNLNRDEDLDVFPLEPKGVRMAQERVELASELESMQHRIKRTNVREKWFQKAAKDAELDDDEESRPKIVDASTENRESDKRIKHLKTRLNALLEVPLSKPMPVTKYPAAYQLHNQSTDKNSLDTKAAIEAVSVAKEEEKRLLKKYGAIRVNTKRKTKNKKKSDKKKASGKKKVKGRKR